MLAAANRHVEMVRLLLEAGADKEASSCYGNAAQMLAAENGHVEMAQLLLEACADKDALSSVGYTALITAEHVTMVRLQRSCPTLLSGKGS